MCKIFSFMLWLNFTLYCFGLKWVGDVMVIMKDTAVDKNTLNSLVGIVRLSLSPFIPQENVIKSIILFTIGALPSFGHVCLFLIVS